MPPDDRLCYSRARAQVDQPVETIVTSGVLADPGASRRSREALWPEMWGRSPPARKADRE